MWFRKKAPAPDALRTDLTGDEITEDELRVLDALESQSWLRSHALVDPVAEAALADAARSTDARVRSLLTNQAS